MSIQGSSVDETFIVKDLLARFQIIEASQLLPPHRCAACAKTSGLFFDWGVIYEWEGSVYLCVDCMGSAVTQLGFLNPELVNALKVHNSNLTNLLQEAREQNDKLRAALGSLSLPELSSVPELVVVEEPETIFSILAELGDDSTDGEEGSSESSNEQGRSSVLNNDGDERLYDSI